MWSSDLTSKQRQKLTSHLGVGILLSRSDIDEIKLGPSIGEVCNKFQKFIFVADNSREAKGMGEVLDIGKDPGKDGNITTQVCILDVFGNVLPDRESGIRGTFFGVLEETVLELCAVAIDEDRDVGIFFFLLCFLCHVAISKAPDPVVVSVRTK
jgi:hypothetical protein